MDDDSALEAALLRQQRPDRASTLEETREQVEQLLLPGLREGGLSPAEARVEAMNVVARFERMTAEKILTSMVDGPREACRTTQHCAYHGWCRRCDPHFAALMSEINHVLWKEGVAENLRGPLYGRIAETLRGSTEVRLAAELAEAKETQQRLERKLRDMGHRVGGLEERGREGT